MQQLSSHGYCFVCGTENPHSIGANWYLKEDGSIFGDITLTKYQQGAPGIAHGGATAALLDEAMGAAVWEAGHKALARRLEVEYHRPVFLGINVQVVARVENVDGKNVQACGELLLPNGKVAVTARGIYVEAGDLISRLFSKLDGEKSWP
ncbi:MAG: PaaI family thioesterase [Chloroflexota bacterium]